MSGPQVAGIRPSPVATHLEAIYSGRATVANRLVGDDPVDPAALVRQLSEAAVYVYAMEGADDDAFGSDHDGGLEVTLREPLGKLLRADVRPDGAAAGLHETLRRHAGVSAVERAAADPSMHDAAVVHD